MAALARLDSGRAATGGRSSRRRWRRGGGQRWMRRPLGQRCGPRLTETRRVGTCVEYCSHDEAVGMMRQRLADRRQGTTAVPLVARLLTAGDVE